MEELKKSIYISSLRNTINETLDEIELTYAELWAERMELVTKLKREIEYSTSLAVDVQDLSLKLQEAKRREI